MQNPYAPARIAAMQKDKKSSKSNEDVKDSILVSLVRRIINTPSPPLDPPLFNFENTREAAIKNSSILKSFGWNPDQAINATQKSILSPGTEFRPTHILEPLLQNHTDWKKFEKILLEGARYPFRQDINYSKEDHKKDLFHAIRKGNNKSATDPHLIPFLQKNYTKEVSKGWMIPFLKSDVMKIEGMGVIPIGIAEQITMDTEGNRIPKKRTTHDLSRPMHSGHSFNSMMDQDKMEPCLFGHALTRILHYIHSIRVRNPTSHIFLSKIDLDAAFRRIHVWLPHAMLATTIIEDIAYLLTRLPFGGAPAPGIHDVASNIVADLAQSLEDDPTWHPEYLHSPYAEDIPPPMRLPEDTPFVQAHPLLIETNDKDCATDVFVDDLITACLGDPHHMSRATHAAALAILTILRPPATNEPIPRDNVLSLRKLAAEGRLEEKKTVLGWDIDTRNFRISLPPDKADRWILDLISTPKL